MKRKGSATSFLPKIAVSSRGGADTGIPLSSTRLLTLSQAPVGFTETRAESRGIQRGGVLEEDLVELESPKGRLVLPRKDL